MIVRVRVIVTVMSNIVLPECWNSDSDKSLIVRVTVRVRVMVIATKHHTYNR